MTKDEGQILIDAIQKLIANGAKSPVVHETVAVGPTGAKLVKGVPLDAHEAAKDAKAFEDFVERIVEAIRERCRVDTVLLALVTQRPSLKVLVEPRVFTLDGQTLKGRIGRLLVAGFLNDPRTSGEVRRELVRTGTDPGGSNIATSLNDFVKDGYLTREGDGYKRAPGIEMTEERITT